jgi:hypothetical protein
MKDIVNFQKGHIHQIIHGFFKSKEMEDIVSNITSWNKTTSIDMNKLLQTIDKMLYFVNQEIEVDQ